MNRKIYNAFLAMGWVLLIHGGITAVSLSLYLKKTNNLIAFLDAYHTKAQGEEWIATTLSELLRVFMHVAFPSITLLTLSFGIIILFLIRREKTYGEQSVPAYPPQGVGSPDP